MGDPTMRITDVRTILLTGPCTEDITVTAIRKRRSAAFVEVHTDVGIVGLGETYAGYFCPEVIPGIVDFFKPILVGQNVDDIRELWERMYRCENFWCRVGLGVSVINGIEAALWDLKGKLLGVPAYELLGGCKHARLPCYATGGPSNYPKDKLAAKIDYYLGLGFRGFKLGAGSFTGDGTYYVANTPAEAADFEADKLAFVRTHVGKEINVMLDGHMGNSPDHTWNLATATAVMKAVEPFDLFFFEEPLHYTDPWGYAELCRATEVPIAGGECLTAAYEWKVFTERDAFDIGQPDASFTGGLSEFMNVAAMLEKRGRKLATHAWGAGGSFMQNLHCGFACANTIMLEIAAAYGPLHRDIMVEPFTMKDGFARAPTALGLGIQLTDETKSRFAFVPGSGEFVSVPGKVLVD